jgi:hypothetical protein
LDRVLANKVAGTAAGSVPVWAHTRFKRIAEHPGEDTADGGSVPRLNLGQTSSKNIIHHYQKTKVQSNTVMTWGIACKAWFTAEASEQYIGWLL